MCVYEFRVEASVVLGSSIGRAVVYIITGWAVRLPLKETFSSLGIHLYYTCFTWRSHRMMSQMSHRDIISNLYALLLHLEISPSPGDVTHQPPLTTGWAGLAPPTPRPVSDRDVTSMTSSVTSKTDARREW